MNIFQYMTRDEIKNRINELDNELRTCSGARLAEIEQEIRSASEALEAGNYRHMPDDDGEWRPEKRSVSPIGPTQILATYGLAAGQVALEGRDLQEKREQRGADLRAGRAVEFGLDELQLRAVTVASGNLVAPTVTAPVLGEGFNEVSSLVDLVNAPSFPGAESYKKGFVVGYGEGGYTGETEEAEDAEPVFDYVSTGKYRITAYAEVSSAAANLDNPNYQNEVLKAMQIALRKKLARQILIGRGPAHEELTGIFHAPGNVVPASSDLELATIDENTLDQLVFGYGGDESLEGGTWLILNKKDLAAFAQIRGTDGKKLYKITIDDNGNTGAISSDESFAVRFVINSACPSLADAQPGQYCMAYGKPLGYEMPLFSPLVVEKSTDYKFRQGMVAFRGEVFVGGTPAAFKVFRRVKKATGA